MICPFCSLLCDAEDLRTISCDRRTDSLAKVASLRREPRREAEAEVGLSEAKRALQRAKRVLVTGRIASVETARAAIAFAIQYNATIDCAEAGHVFKNVLALQRSGMHSVSIAEARDHSDLFIIVGDDRMLRSVPRMPAAFANYSPISRTVLLLGEFGLDSIRKWKGAGFDTWAVHCDLKNVPMALSQWARWSDRVSQDQAKSKEEAERSHASGLLDRMARSAYTTVLWCAEHLTMEHADLWVERMFQWVATRNEKSRCAALPWTSTDGTFQQVCTWQTGFPGRVAFRDGVPEYDPLQNAYEQWLERASRIAATESVVVLIDETASATTFLQPQTIPQLKNSAVIELTGTSEWFPTAIAGIETGAGLFRADQTLLANVLPTIEPPVDCKPATFWLEGLSR